MAEYGLVRRGDRFDLIHRSAAQIGGRMIRLREIVRPNIPEGDVLAVIANRPAQQGSES